MAALSCGCVHGFGGNGLYKAVCNSVIRIYFNDVSSKKIKDTYLYWRFKKINLDLESLVSY